MMESLNSLKELAQQPDNFREKLKQRAETLNPKRLRTLFRKFAKSSTQKYFAELSAA